MVRPANPCRYAAAAVVVLSLSMHSCMTMSGAEYEEKALASGALKVRKFLAEDATIRGVKALIEAQELTNGNPARLGTAELKTYDVLLAAPVARARSAHETQFDNLRQLLGAITAYSSRTPPADLAKEVKLSLTLSNTGHPTAYVDPATGIFRLDLRVLRALVLASLTSTLKDVDLEQSIADLEFARREHAAGRKDKLDASIPKPDHMSREWDRKVARERREKEEKIGRRTAEETGRLFARAVDLVVAMDPAVYAGRYQRADGDFVRPREVAWELAWPRMAGDPLSQYTRGAFVTMLLHEMGHLVLGHGKLDLNRLSCDERAQLELEADSYSAALRALSGLDREYAPGALLSFSTFETLGRGTVQAIGIAHFFDLAYPGSGFEAGGPPETACYPSAEERQRVATQMNTELSKIINERVGAATRDCLEAAMRKNAAEHMEDILKGREITLDLTKVECP